jgi:hypothetical protein
MSMCNEIYSKHIHCDCIFGRSRQETETHINEMSACHVSLFQDSHLHHSCRGISTSVQWLVDGHLKKETKSFIVAAQEQGSRGKGISGKPGNVR